MLVIDYSSSARDVPSSTPTPPSPSAKPNVLLPLFFPPPPQPSSPTRCLLPPSPLPCSTSTTTIRSRSSLLAHHVLAASTHRAEQRDVARTRGRTFRAQPFLFLFSSFGGGLFSPEGRRKRVGEGRGGVDLCQIKLKPPLSPHLSLDAGHSEYGFALGIRGVSIVGDWSPTTTFPPFPHFFPLYLLL